MVEDKCLTLFDAPLSRLTDPPTSVLAAKRLRSSGKWGSQKRAVFEALHQNNGSTSAELARIMAADRYLPSRRLSELVEEGLVLRGRIRKCRVNGNRCLTWWVVEEAKLF